MQASALNLNFDNNLSKSDWSRQIKLVEAKECDTLFYGTVSTPLGKMTLCWADDGVRYLGFEEKRSLEKARHFWPDVNFKADKNQAMVLADRILKIWKGESADVPLVMAVKGTSFQRDVWTALLRIPTGHVVSYGTVAQYVGRPAAVRAVGTAVGSNPVSLLIPCHRVIQSNGSVKNYGWGDAMKQSLLKAEATYKKS